MSAEADLPAYGHVARAPAPAPEPRTTAAVGVRGRARKIPTRSVGRVTRLPVPVVESYLWQERGACLEVEPSLFFHPEGERGESRRARDRAAVTVCGGCPVLGDCRRHALNAQEPYGVWGGLTEDDRRRAVAPSRDLQLVRPWARID